MVYRGSAIGREVAAGSSHERLMQLLNINSEVQQTDTSVNAIKKDPVNRTYDLQRGQRPRDVLRPIHR